MPFIELDSLPEKTVFAGFNGKFFHSDTMTFVYWDIDADAKLPVHSHPHEQVVNMIEGEFELTINGEPRRLKPGHIAIIPRNAPHSGRSITRCRILDVFEPIREDYR